MSTICQETKARYAREGLVRAYRAAAHDRDHGRDYSLRRAAGAEVRADALGGGDRGMPAALENRSEYQIIDRCPPHRPR